MEETPEAKETQENTSSREKTPEVDEQVGTEVSAGDSTSEWHNLFQDDFKKEDDGESASETETETDDSTGLEGTGVYKLEEFEDLEEAVSGAESDQEQFDESGDSQDEDEEESHSESYSGDEDDEFRGDYDYHSEDEQQMLEDLLEEMRGNCDEYEPPTRPATRPAILPASHFKCSICGTQAVRRVAGENAMPHNQGRAFYKCPNPLHGSYFKWEDGSLPFSEQSQARFNDFMDAGFGYY